jgi:hypothetical protein
MRTVLFLAIVCSLAISLVSCTKKESTANLDGKWKGSNVVVMITGNQWKYYSGDEQKLLSDYLWKEDGRGGIVVYKKAHGSPSINFSCKLTEENELTCSQEGTDASHKYTRE